MLEQPHQLISVILNEGTFYGFQLNGVIWSRSLEAGPKDPWILVYDPSGGASEKKIGLRS